MSRRNKEKEESSSLRKNNEIIIQLKLGYSFFMLRTETSSSLGKSRNDARVEEKTIVSITIKMILFDDIIFTPLLSVSIIFIRIEGDYFFDILQ